MVQPLAPYQPQVQNQSQHELHQNPHGVFNRLNDLALKECISRFDQMTFSKLCMASTSLKQRLNDVSTHETQAKISQNGQHLISFVTQFGAIGEAPRTKPVLTREAALLLASSFDFAKHYPEAFLSFLQNNSTDPNVMRTALYNPGINDRHHLIIALGDGIAKNAMQSHHIKNEAIIDYLRFNPMQSIQESEALYDLTSEVTRGDNHFQVVLLNQNNGERADYTFNLDRLVALTENPNMPTEFYTGVLNICNALLLSPDPTRRAYGMDIAIAAALNPALELSQLERIAEFPAHPTLAPEAVLKTTPNPDIEGQSVFDASALSNDDAQPNAKNQLLTLKVALKNHPNADEFILGDDTDPDPALETPAAQAFPGYAIAKNLNRATDAGNMSDPSHLFDQLEITSDSGANEKTRLLRSLTKGLFSDQRADRIARLRSSAYKEQVQAATSAYKDIHRL